MDWRKKPNLVHQKFALQWCQIGLILAFIVVLGVNFGCVKENDKGIDENNNPEKEVVDEYYIKYIVKSSTRSGYSRTARINSGNNTSNSFTFYNSPWEMTIGPVKKGFNASVSASFNNNGQPIATPHISVEIHVSKNNSPFALKSSNDINIVRTSASTGYTIN